MKIVIRPQGKDKAVFVTHPGCEDIDFSALKIAPNFDGDRNVLFNEINEYWSTMSKKEQRELYNVYSDISDVMDSFKDTRDNMSRLQTLVARLLDDFHNIDRMRKYVEKHIEIDYPDNVKDTFDENNGRRTRELTYITSEYFDLVVVTISIRCLVPVWMVYRDIQRTGDNMHTAYVDLALLRIMKYSEYLNNDAVMRLYAYVLEQYKRLDRSRELGSVVSGLGTDEIPNYIFISVLVNKLAWKTINEQVGIGNLISAVHDRIKHDTSKIGEKFTDLRPRKDSRLNDSEDGKIGYLESYSVRQAVSDDIYLANQIYLQDYRKVLKHVDPTCPAGLAKRCMDSYNRCQPEIIGGVPVILVQWVLGNVVMARTVPYINRSAMISAIATTQALLIHWNFRHIAALLSADELENEDDLAMTMITPSNKLESGLRDRLAEIYPHHRPNREKSPKNLIPALLAIDEFLDMILDREWNLKVNATVAEQLRQNAGVFKPDPNLRNELAELFITLHRIRNTKHEQ